MKTFGKRADTVGSSVYEGAQFRALGKLDFLFAEIQLELKQGSYLEQLSPDPGDFPGLATLQLLQRNPVRSGRSR